MKTLSFICLLLLSFLAEAQTETDLLILNRKYTEALTHLEKELRAAPKAVLFFKQGLVYEKLMDYESAIVALNKACEMESGNTMYWEELADAHSALGNYLYSVTCFKKAIAIDPADIRMKGKLAQTYINLKAYPDAFRCYEQIWERDSTNTFYNRYFAYAAYKVGKDELAVRLYEQLAAKGSGDLNTWVNLATIYNQQRKINEAIATCKRGLDIFPQNPFLLQKIADSYFSFREYGKAMYAYENYLAVADSTLDVLKNYGICLYFEKQEEKALTMLEPCYENSIEDPIVNFYMGACFKRMKMFDVSEGYLKLAIETATPSYLAEIYHHLAQVYGSLRKFEESIKAYKSALEIDPSKSEVLFEIASTYEEFNANKVVALHYYREYAKAVREKGANINYALDRIKKIKEELFFEDGSTGISN